MKKTYFSSISAKSLPVQTLEKYLKEAIKPSL